jgi:molybdenum ABC transporter molybdate-binding protein
MSRLSPALVAFGASVLLLGGLVGALAWIRDTGPANSNAEPLEIYCAAALKLPLEAISKEYEAEFGQKVYLHFGPSQAILHNLEFMKKGDLFLPADHTYVSEAKKKKLVDETAGVARMQAVVIVRSEYSSEVKTWDDFLRPGTKIGLPNVEAAALGKILKLQLQGIGLWDAVEARKPTFLGDINETANSVAIGSSDVGIVWDAVALPLQAKRPGLKVVRLQELDGVQARVQIALTTFTKQPGNARRFVDYLRAKDKGAPHLKKLGFHEVEKRENVKVTRIYNGCGILVTQMKAGEVPDLYFACDVRFMNDVKNDFIKPTNVSSNQLMIVVKKGNPKKIFTLNDLAAKGLKVGVGHEQQCALGTLTKEAFEFKGLYGDIRKNVVVQSPTGDFLVNQLRTGSLDAVVAYRSNIVPYPDELEGTPITGIDCAMPSQPIAVSKNSNHPELSRRLMEFLKTAESRQRFEKLGFGWEVKETEK